MDEPVKGLLFALFALALLLLLEGWSCFTAVDAAEAVWAGWPLTGLLLEGEGAVAEALSSCFAGGRADMADGTSECNGY